ncbi:MAG: peroxiredoxin-like family protein [Puniceicoccaceae bacterium]
MNILSLLKKNAVPIVAVAAIATYIYIAGKSGACPSCAFITQTVGLSSQSTASVIPVSQKYPDEPLGVGDSIPAGVLRDEDGQNVELAGLVSGKPTVFVFYRGGWCPFCVRHLSSIVDIIPELEKNGVQLVAVSPDRPAVLEAKDKLQGLNYSLLSDSSMSVSQSFGIAFKVEESLVAKYKSNWNIDIEGDSGYSHHLLPHPSVYVVDGKGVIQFGHVNPDYKVRLDPDQILKAAKAASVN